jgi:hypothetical protein
VLLLLRARNPHQNLLLHASVLFEQ